MVVVGVGVEVGVVMKTYDLNSARRDSVYIGPKLTFYAHILCKALVHGTDASITHDQFVENELTDRWETLYPELVLAWEKNNDLRQANKKVYEKNEADIIATLTPVPGGKL